MSWTAYGRSQVLGHYLTGGGAPATLYVALTTKVPALTDDGSILAAQEPAGGGYARVAYATSGGWYELWPGLFSNARGVTFPTATTDWGWVRGWALCTASSGGLVLVSDALRQVRRVGSGIAVQIHVDGLQLGSR